MVGLIKYKRVMQRIKEQYQENEFPLKALEDAIFLECGTDPRTVKSAIDRMKRLEFIKESEPERKFGVMQTKKFRLINSENEMF